MSADVDNPRIQCDLCGKWRRLYDSEINQLMFPLYSEDYNGTEYSWIQDDLEFDSLCVWCHLLFGLVCDPFEEITNDQPY